MSATLVKKIEAPGTVSAWDPYPTLYEINTWVWLTGLSQKYGRRVNLSSVPSAEWDAIAAYGFDSVWFMGVWERSPAGIAIANQNKSLLDDFRRALPDFCPEDNVGSPYCVRRYVVDGHLGGPEGLTVARRELSTRGVNLILDFVPNHVAPDHPWVEEHPEYFIRGSADDARNDPSSYISLAGTVCACGRDPYFPAWPDVLQLNAFEPIMGWSLFKSIQHLSSACLTLQHNCVAGIEPNYALLAKRVRESVTLVTALNPIIGYEKAALIAKTAIKTGQPIDEVAESLGIMTRQQMEELLVPEKLTQPLSP